MLKQDRQRHGSSFRTWSPVSRSAPVCTAWSALSNAVPYDLRMKKREAVMPMVDFTMAIATYQHEAGRYFMIENPETSQMWSLPCMKELLSLSGVSYGTAHMCAYGLVDPVSKLPMKKAMRLAHNFPPDVMEEFFQKCTKDHDHQSVVAVSYTHLTLPTIYSV